MGGTPFFLIWRVFFRVVWERKREKEMCYVFDLDRDFMSARR